MALTDAPHTGARLETTLPNWNLELYQDAPHTGARIETLCRPLPSRSPPRCPPHGGTT